MQLSNGTYVVVSFYLVYPEPNSPLAQQRLDRDTVTRTTEYSWSLVTRGVMLMLLEYMLCDLYIEHDIVLLHVSLYAVPISIREISRTDVRLVCARTCLLSKFSEAGQVCPQ